ncbi:DsbA family protein [Gymnodinialimonas sp. 2305UL16-5]|uniref:DsbA family protein n=1 Tax=Gymnodinialimonas mytili TaxID=3126503 RepID=UPI0030AB0F94
MATRRGLLKGALFLGGAWAIMARPWNWVLMPELSYEPIEGLAPFRRLANGGDISAGGGSAADAVLVGLDAPDRVDPAILQRLRDDPTAALWDGWDGTGPVPVTYFTDIRCPICRVLEPRLAALDGIRLTTREYPLFGDISVQAARGILSAAQQGQGEAMRSRLHRAPPGLGDDALVQMAAGLGLDAARFEADLAGPEVAARLAEDRGLAQIFGLPGTPALIIGRTSVVGLQSVDMLEQIVAAERA